MNITDIEAVHLLINAYIIKQLNSAETPVEEKEFVEYVQKVFLENDINYTREQILITWRHLLEKYHYFKENTSVKQASEAWPLFSLMDMCFNDSRSTHYKFSDPNSTFNLIKCMSDYKQIILNQGLTMNILRNVEKKLKNMEYDISQRDIYIQWNNLTKCYEDKEKQIQSQNSYNKFLEAMEFYIYNAEDDSNGSNSKKDVCKTGEVSTEKLRKLDTQNDSVCFNTTANNSSYNVTNNAQGTPRKGCYNHSKLLYKNLENIVNYRKEASVNENVSSLLQRHETGYRELAELKELLLENNLLRKEYKYLLNLFSNRIKSRNIDLTEFK